MVQPGRVACILAPFLFCLASLICIIIVLLGGVNPRSTTLGNYYFFKADLTGVLDVDIVPGTDIDEDIVDALQEAVNVHEFYTIYLWNYCAWNNDEDRFSFCSKREQQFAFDPLEVWGLEGTELEDAIPQEIRDGLDIYTTASKWMFVAYIVALVATILELLVGIVAIFSRWGSLLTTAVASLAMVFIVAASITATALFSIMVGLINDQLEKYGVTSSVGLSVLRVSWLGAAFSIVAALFWFFSVCCCSGRSPYAKAGKSNKAKGDSYTYEKTGAA